MTITEKIENFIGDLYAKHIKTDLLTLSPNIYSKLDDEANKKRLGTQLVKIDTFYSTFGEVRVLQSQQSEDIIAFQEIIKKEEQI